MKIQRDKASINASSMADIAFLLLVFFLVTTSMDIDKGIMVVLPPHVDDPSTLDYHAKEVLEIHLNAKNELLIEGEEAAIKDIKEMVVTHLDNNGKLQNFSTSPQKAIVSIQNDNGTTYSQYIAVYNEIRAGYNQVREQKAQADHQKSFENLSLEQKKRIKTHYPIKISEAEPTNFDK